MGATILYMIFVMLTVPAIGQHKFLFDASKQPYVLVDSFSVDLKFLVLSSDKIETVNVLKDSNAVETYGDKARNGVVIIKTKTRL